jgi:RNA-splicing ligase RtcB
MININLQQKNYNTGIENFQLMLPINYEVIIPEDDLVRLLSQIVEELDYKELYKAYSPMDKIVPGVVGVDIGCGMETVKLAEKKIDYAMLDNLIRREIPAGRKIRSSYHSLSDEVNFNALRCIREINLERARRSIGTLGGGNHFIEVGKSENGNLYLVVHSGSRHIGSQVADYYQDEAWKSLCGNSKQQIEEIITILKAEGRHKKIADTVAQMKLQQYDGDDPIPKDLAYIRGELFANYIHDMKIIQHFAVANRKAMTEVILQGLRLTETDRFTTTHNYIDTESMILRKGAVSAKEDERLLIPINMRDGSLICVGKGNPDWNYSAPHGAGRLMSRMAAFKALSMDEYKSEMTGIFSTSVNSKTLDESPMAYKDMNQIISHIEPTVKIVERIRPTYSFKASE